MASIVVTAPSKRRFQAKDRVNGYSSNESTVVANAPGKPGWSKWNRGSGAPDKSTVSAPVVVLDLANVKDNVLAFFDNACHVADQELEKEKLSDYLQTFFNHLLTHISSIDQLERTHRQDKQDIEQAHMQIKQLQQRVLKLDSLAIKNRSEADVMLLNLKARDNELRALKERNELLTHLAEHSATHGTAVSPTTASAAQTAAVLHNAETEKELTRLKEIFATKERMVAKEAAQTRKAMQHIGSVLDGKMTVFENAITQRFRVLKRRFDALPNRLAMLADMVKNNGSVSAEANQELEAKLETAQRELKMLRLVEQAREEREEQVAMQHMADVKRLEEEHAATVEATVEARVAEALPRELAVARQQFVTELGGENAELKRRIVALQSEIEQCRQELAAYLSRSAAQLQQTPLVSTEDADTGIIRTETHAGARPGVSVQVGLPFFMAVDQLRRARGEWNRGSHTAGSLAPRHSRPSSAPNAPPTATGTLAGLSAFDYDDWLQAKGSHDVVVIPTARLANADAETEAEADADADAGMDVDKSPATVDVNGRLDGHAQERHLEAALSSSRSANRMSGAAAAKPQLVVSASRNLWTQADDLQSRQERELALLEKDATIAELQAQVKQLQTQLEATQETPLPLAHAETGEETADRHFSLAPLNATNADGADEETPTRAVADLQSSDVHHIDVDPNFEEEVTTETQIHQEQVALGSSAVGSAQSSSSTRPPLTVPSASVSRGSVATNAPRGHQQVFSRLFEKSKQMRADQLKTRENYLIERQKALEKVLQDNMMMASDGTEANTKTDQQGRKKRRPRGRGKGGSTDSRRPSTTSTRPDSRTSASEKDDLVAAFRGTRSRPHTPKRSAIQSDAGRPAVRAMKSSFRSRSVLASVTSFKPRTTSATADARHSRSGSSQGAAESERLNSMDEIEDMGLAEQVVMLSRMEDSQEEHVESHGHAATAPSRTAPPRSRKPSRQNVTVSKPHSSRGAAPRGSRTARSQSVFV